MIDQELASLGEAMGQPIGLDERGVCALAFEGGIEVVIEVPPDSELVYLHAALASAEVEQRERLLELALTLNLYGIETQGAALALDPASRRIVLCWSQPLADLGEGELAPRLLGFVDAAIRLKERLAQPAAAGNGQDDGLHMDAFDLTSLRNAGGPWVKG